MRSSNRLRPCGLALTASTSRAQRTRHWRVVLIVLLLVSGVVVAVNNGVLNVRGSALVAGAVAATGVLRLIVVKEPDERPGPFTRIIEAGAPSPRGATWLQDRERTLELATATSGDAYRLLRPAVAHLVDEWLRATHGVDLGDPDAVRHLPSELWDLVRPDRSRPENPHAAGPTRSEVAGIIDRLEALP